MKFNIIIDARVYSLNTFSLNTLSNIIKTITNPDSLVKENCNGLLCGNCIVLESRTHKPVIPCITPIFEASGREFTTYESFKTTLDSTLIFNAIKELGASPCNNCWKSKILLFEAAITEYVQTMNSTFNNSIWKHQIISEEKEYNIKKELEDKILEIMHLSKCRCISDEEMCKIVEKVANIKMHKEQ